MRILTLLLTLCLFSFTPGPYLNTMAQAQGLIPLSDSGTAVSAIQSIRFKPGQQSLVLLSSARIQPQIQYLKQAQKIVLDLPNTVLPQVHHEIAESSQAIARIRISQYQKEPPSVRMVMDLQKPLEVSVRSRKLNQGFETLIEPVQSGDMNANAHHEAQILKDLYFEGQNLILKGNAPIYPEIRQSSAERNEYKLTLYDFKTEMGGPIPGLSSDLVKDVAVFEDGDRVIVRIRLKRSDLQVIPFSRGNQCTLQMLVQTSQQNTAVFTQMEVEELDRQTTRLRLQASQMFDFQIYPLGNPQRLVIDTLATALSDKLKDRSFQNSPNLRNIRFIPTNQAGKSDIRIVLDLQGDVTYQFDLQNNVLDVWLKSKEQRPLLNANTRRALVVIDAGHGGTDPGTVGLGRTQEKKITLAVSNYLKRYLENDQIQVLMTRSEDMEVLLQPRVDIANLRDADVFVSVHVNAMPKGNEHVKGIETYYTTPQSRELADTLHGYLVKELKAQDRRVRKRGLYVTRKTSMPSVLLEIGFLSNPEEEALLDSPQYQRRIAKAIRDGLYDYLSRQQKKQPRT